MDLASPCRAGGLDWLWRNIQRFEPTQPDAQAVIAASMNEAAVSERACRERVAAAIGGGRNG